MYGRLFTALAVSCVVSAMAWANEPVAVSGTNVKYSRTLTIAVKDQPVAMKLTGAGLRKKVFLHVYTIGSYVQEGCTAKTASDVTKAEGARLLHMILQRSVDSKDLIGAFKTAIQKNYPPERFAAELAQLEAVVAGKTAEKGDHITLVAIPGGGVRMQINNKVDATIGNPAFSQALWEVFLGANPVDETLKSNLVSLLGQ